MRKHFLIILSVCSMLSACGQTTNQKSNNTTNQTKKTNNMDTSKLINSTVKAAFDVWQNGDAKTFLSFFTADATLTDDGNPRNFQSFVKDACGKERFTSIDKVENEGTAIYGHFHTESWGDFNTFFKFNINDEGKIYQLDIGQAN